MGVVKVTIEIPYFEIEIGDIKRVVETDDTGHRHDDIEFDIDLVNFPSIETKYDVVEWDEESMEEFARLKHEERRIKQEETCND